MPVASAVPAFTLYHGNDLELLAGLLAGQLARPVAGRPLLEPDTVLIPQPAMRRWLQKTLAETHGVAANLRFLAPGEFVAEVLDANVAGAGDAAVGDAQTLHWRLWSVLSAPGVLEEPVFAPLRPLLGGDAAALAAWALSGELAATFEKYQAWRREWLRRWDRGGDRDDWQAELWRRATRGLSHRGKRLDAYLTRFDGEGDGLPAGLPPRVFAFACQNVSPDVLRVIGSSARAGELHFFFLSPVAGWWGDLQTVRERLHADPSAVFDDTENPLLRANGAAGRDFVRTLFSYEVVHPAGDFPLYVPPDPETRSGVLHRMQRDLLARQPLPAAGDEALPAFASVGRDDVSLQVHSCHTRLREVQVLHDQLRHLLEADPELQPRDIAVLTPDIDAYAAHVQAVFGGNNAALQQIPFALADTSVLVQQPVAEAFLELLALPNARFTGNEVLDLLRVPAIAQRLRLEDADFEQLAAWLRESGARWGLDGAHRSAHGAPAEPAYTWAWALDRLLLGHASGSSHDIAGVAPWPDLEGGSLDTLDALLQGLHRLAALQRDFAGEHLPERWQQLLSQAIDDLFAEHPLDPGDRRALESLRGLVARFGRQTRDAALRSPLPHAVVRAWFASALADSDPRQPYLTGGVTFGRMVPMRLVPFKVICLLGMNDGDFPRRDPSGGLNRLTAELSGNRRQPGDRSIRDDDRGLFLQLLAAATQTFYLSYLGQDPRSGEKQPPSVVVSELLDVAARYFRDADEARDGFTVRHALQPFTAAAFGGEDGRRLSYQAHWRPAADATGQLRLPMPRFAGDLPAPVADTAPQQVTRAELFRALSNPSREFLSHRLGLRLPDRRERLPDAEPFDSRDGLHRYALTQRVFDAALAGQHVDSRALFRRLLAEGLVAPAAAGEQEVFALMDRLAPALQAWRDWGDHPARTMPYDLELGAFTLSGSLPRVHGNELRQFSASAGHGKTLLGVGIDALVWSALGQAGSIRRVLGDGRPVEVPPLPAAEARAHLHALLQVLVQARARALPFMPRAGHEHHKYEGERAWRCARDAWTGNFGEGRDPWVRLALRGADPFCDDDSAVRDEFAALSARIFGSLPGAVVMGHGP